MYFLHLRKLLLLLFLNVGLMAAGYAQEISDMLEKALSAVVTVAVYKTDSGNIKKLLGFNTRGAVNRDLAYEKILNLYGSQGSGSGFIIQRKGKKYAVTNAHVVESAAGQEGIFAFSVSQRKYRMKILGGDSFYDLAVLEFMEDPGDEIGTIEFDERPARIGQTIYAIGNPLGEFPYSVTQGIISGKNRVRTAVTGKFGFLQSSATVIWGNSGGPLVNADGRVMGINSQISFAKNGDQSIWQPQINFALENVVAQTLVNEIIDLGYVRRGYLGIELGQPYYAQDTEKIAIHDKVVLYNVIPGSPAAGVLKDKVKFNLVKISGVTIRNVQEALGELEKVKPDVDVVLTLSNNGAEESVTVRAAALQKNQLVEQLNYYLKSKNVDVISTGEELLIELPSKGRNENGTPKAKQRYQLVTAGIYNSENTKHSYLWRVQSLGDLAGILRITGPYGYIDLLLLDPRTKEVIRRTLVISYEQGTYNKTIWY